MADTESRRESEVPIAESIATAASHDAAATVDPATILPTQNQLYAIFMHSCGKFRVRRPHKHIMRLLEDFDARPKRRRSTDQSGEEGQLAEAAAAAVVASDAGAANDNAADNDAAAPIPLALRTSLPMGPASGHEMQHYGNTTLAVLVELLYFLPKLERLDWSVVKVFDVDAYKQGIPGNEVLRMLFDWASTHPSVQSIDIRGCIVGTQVAHYATMAVTANPNLTEVVLDERGIEAFVLKQMHRALEKNRSGANPNPRPQPGLSPRALEELSELQDVDRKTSESRQAMHLLLWENEAPFAPLLHWEDELKKTKRVSSSSGAASSMNTSTTDGEAAAIAAANTAPLPSPPQHQHEGDPYGRFVLKATRIATSECINASRGLRGDESNLFLVATGELQATVGAQKVVLRRGDYFGETLESVMFSAGSLSVAERGLVYQIPHSVCGLLFQKWEKQVETLLPALRRCPTLQALPLWLLIHCCHDAKFGSISNGETLHPSNAHFSGLWVIVTGRVVTQAPPQVASKRQRRARGLGDQKEVDIKPQEFTSLDIVGEEAALTRNELSTVDLVCVSDEPTQYIHLSLAMCQRHIVPLLKTPLMVQAKTYCLDW